MRPAFNLATLVIYTAAVIILTSIAFYGANEYIKIGRAHV